MEMGEIFQNIKKQEYLILCYKLFNYVMLISKIIDNLVFFTNYSNILDIVQTI